MVNLEIDKICRVCLLPDSSLCPLFVENCLDEISIPDIIKECTNYTVCRNDNFPQLICNDCKKRAHSAYSFKQLYEASIRTLTAFLVSVNKYPEEHSNTNESISEGVEIKTESDMNIKTEIFEDIVENLKAKGSSGLDTSSGAEPSFFVRIEHLQQNELMIKSEKPSDPGTEDETESEEPNFSFQPQKGAKRKENSTEDLVSRTGKPKLLKGQTKLKEESPLSEEGVQNDKKSSNEERLSLFPCDKCNKTFKLQKNLQCHLVSHLEEHPDHCTTSETQTKSPSDKKATSRRKSKFDNLSDLKKIFPCELCDKKFPRKASLRLHNLRYHNMKRFACNECDYSSHSKEKFQAHIRTHTGERPYKCTKCDKSFNRNDNLKVHFTLIHTENRSYKCQDCNKTFVSSYSLERHQISSHGERVHQCKLCPKNYARPDHLTLHMKRHK